MIRDEHGPGRAPTTVPLTPLMRDMWLEVYADVADAHERGDVYYLFRIAGVIPQWVRASPFPNIAAHVGEYIHAALDTVVPKPQPELSQVVCVVEDARKRWGGVDRDALAKPTHGRKENWLYE